MIPSAAITNHHALTTVRNMDIRYAPHWNAEPAAAHHGWHRDRTPAPTMDSAVAAHNVTANRGHGIAGSSEGDGLWRGSAIALIPH